MDKRILALFALKNLKASTVGMFIYLQPVIGILFAIYRGADKLTAADITSVILVFVVYIWFLKDLPKLLKIYSYICLIFHLK